ncbi:uncharacterized protein LOC126780115 [Nymphalis io]|uniref:uncharacterized protein LOC126780115 n=1 Tax=Inachis io TaxID=171585 RepID=UPI002168AFB7|nr:uncharacterized protein LOC126780115 [Nymphalis io]
MLLRVELFGFLCFLTVTYTERRSDRENAKQLPQRINQLIINYNERGVLKINEIIDIRAKYEVSPHFELGYVVSEILERYRKMVLLVIKPIDYISDVVLETLKHTELIQSLFLEIYHLVQMLHEIMRKYKTFKEFSDKMQYDRTVIDEYNKKLKMNQLEREKERKRKIKEMKKRTKLFMKGIINIAPPKTKPKNKWWPIDYGWEIDYYW